MSPSTHSTGNTQKEDPNDLTFTHMLHALCKRQAFPFSYPKGEDPYLIQTHASAVILTPHYVYKLKKPRNFGFFDYSTSALRRHFCQMEVLLNDQLAPDVYLGVASVIEAANGTFRFGQNYPPGSVPLPQTSTHSGIIVDYAVVMRRLPEEATALSLLRAGKLTPELMVDIAHVVAHFHIRTRSDQRITQIGGSMATLQKNWDENFQQMRPYIGQTIDRRQYTTLQQYVSQFMKQHRELFERRCQEGRIRDCHGDLRLQHIYLLPRTNTPVRQRILLLDRIEFNERIRYGDVASEVAFLCMELDNAGRPDLSHTFLTHYCSETGDTQLTKLLPFYACYRACVRGKVASFLLDDPDISPNQRTRARQEASELFRLAAGYSRRSEHPILILIGGLMGTGKSTVARELQNEYYYPLLSTDTIRKQLAHLEKGPPRADSFNSGLYTPEWTRRTYDTLNQRAQAYLQQGSSVIVDGTFVVRAERQRLAHEAKQHGARTIFVECTLPREITLQRLALRWQARIQAGGAPKQEASPQSDGRPELYDAQARRQESFDPLQEPGVEHIELSTSKSPGEIMERLRCELKRILIA